MKPILVFLFTCFSLSSYSQTQFDMDTMQYHRVQKAEKKLNKIYNQILNENKNDTLYLKNFKYAQSQWLKFCNAQIEVKFPKGYENKQRRMRSMCYNYYKEYLTNQRIKELKEMIISVEGDVCR